MLVICLSCLAFLGGGELRAQLEIRAGTELSSLPKQLAAEGWSEVMPGVFKRQRPGQAEESFAVGAEGLGWVIQQVRNRYTLQLERYRQEPTGELEASLASLRAELVELAAARTRLQQDPPVVTVACDVSYGCAANAYALTGSQGVGAGSSSYFYNNCAHQGTTYADAYGYTAAGSDGRFQSRNGSSVSAAASVTVGGGPTCFSDTYSYVNAATLGISYFSCYDSNSSCPPPPPPPLVLNVYGTAWVTVYGSSCEYLSWSASASGGTPPYSYSWTIPGYGSGTGTSASITVCGFGGNYTENITAYWTVTDSASQSKSSSYTTTVDYQSFYDCPQDPFTPAPIFCIEEPH